MHIHVHALTQSLSALKLIVVDSVVYKGNMAYVGNIIYTYVSSLFRKLCRL